MDLSKLIIRLYTQTEDPKIQRRCLDMIDEMELHHFLGLIEEMKKIDR
jgi:type IV secretory pathway TraG/TraD family ATPase VirD4